ncbi:hypothetical protein H4S08_000390 [Coemansia sp. RSA 1365]|nr:hypothetical protein H4S08_000390 [Coemansia sp. RSA 1365]
MVNPLHLYRSILRTHRRLPREIRFVGDQYVRGEFRNHRTVTDKKYLEPFFKQWAEYLSLVQEQTKSGDLIENVSQPESVRKWEIGKHLDAELLEKLDDDKAEQLLELHRASHKEDDGLNDAPRNNTTPPKRGQ